MGLLPDSVDIFGGAGGALAIFKNILIGLVVFIVVCAAVGFFIYKRVQNKKFNIPLIIITPRSDGKVVEINTGIGGFFKSKKVGGITSFKIKRKGIGVVEIPPEPVMPTELNYVDTFAGETRVPILKLKAINQDATAWSFDNAETAKKRFTFLSIWDKYQVMITLMIFIFILFLVMYINWMGLKDVVAGLADVADVLKTSTRPVIIPNPIT